MKILQISTVYPVKPLPDDNPYVRNYIQKYQQTYHESFVVVKPESYIPAFLIPIARKRRIWRKRRQICKEGFYKENNISIFILPYFSVGSVSWLHSIFTSIIFKLNKKRIRDLLNQRFDIIHAHFLFPDGLLAYHISRRLNIPYILTTQQELRFLDNKLSLKWVKKIINNASVVTTLSTHMLEGLQKKGISNVQLLTMGIEAYFFKFDCHSERSLRSEESPPKFAGDPSLLLRMTKEKIAGTQDDKKRKLKLLSVCNLLPVKNLETVIAAISRMPEKDQLIYTIYGTGPSEDKLKSLVQQLELEQTIHFKGAVKNKDLPAIMPEFDVFIQPSFKETFGLSYFEAMACGLPVILTRNTGAYEMIKDKDVYYLVDPHEPATIMNCLQGIISDRETLVRKATTAPEVAKIASWGPFVAYFHEKYEEVVNNCHSECSEAE